MTLVKGKPVMEDAELNEHFKKAQNKEPKEILKDPNLLERLVKETGLKITGEINTRRFLILVACNIWVANSQERPHVLVTSKSSTGKSYVVRKILELFPPERVMIKSRISKTALTYMNSNDPNWSYNGKILYLEDIEEDVLNSDVHKVMLSGELQESSIVVRPGTVVNFRVNGTPLEFTTTAESEPKVEIINRYNQISLDESSEQTHNINIYTARSYMNNNVSYDPHITKALSVLERVEIFIPFGEKVVNSFPIGNVKSRRDFKRFLELIMCSTALYQFQRKKDSEGALIAERLDYENARKCFEKLQLSQGLVNLTPTEKEMLEVCKKLSKKSITISEETNQETIMGFTAEEAFTSMPNLSQRYWYKILNKFASKDYGLLEINLKKIEGAKKPVKHFKFVHEFNAINLPKFEDL